MVSQGKREDTDRDLWALTVKEGPRTLQRLTVQKAIIAEARKEGLTTKEIVARLVFAVGTKRERARIAVEWAEALEITEKEARRLAG